MPKLKFWLPRVHSNQIEPPHNPNPMKGRRHIVGVKYTTQCTISSVRCATNNGQRMVYSVQCTVHIVHCTLYNVQCKVYSVLCTVYSLQSTVYSVRCTMYNTQYTVQIVQCTVYSQGKDETTDSSTLSLARRLANTHLIIVLTQNWHLLCFIN